MTQKITYNNWSQHADKEFQTIGFITSNYNHKRLAELYYWLFSHLKNLLAFFVIITNVVFEIKSVDACQARVRSTSKASVVSFSKQRLAHCRVLHGLVPGTDLKVINIIIMYLITAEVKYMVI